jgi:alkanesulfonate monooxygenase SsuD/methylene tetrahydromethanopterin reductase-like flavin-dependent oxidoreductase (luciferase family)
MTERQGQSRSDAVRVGVLLPSRETAMTGEHDGPGVVAFARDAEAAGFDSIWTGDSPLARIRMDPMPLLAAVAATTTRVALGTAAFTVALRHPLLAAHSAATVDQLSGGRLILGLGAGFPVPESRREFETLGVPFADRSARLDEIVALWRDLWWVPALAGDLSGAHSELDARPRLLPAARRGGPPLWLAGGDTAGVIQRVAARYDGWLPFLPDPARYARAWDAIRDRASQLGRDVVPGLYATIHLGDDEGQATDALDAYLRAYYGRPLTELAAFQASCAGSPQHCLDWLGGYIDAGARHIVLRLGAIQPRSQLDLAAEFLPLLRTVGPTVPG